METFLLKWEWLWILGVKPTYRRHTPGTKRTKVVSRKLQVNLLSPCPLFYLCLLKIPKNEWFWFPMLRFLSKVNKIKRILLVTGSSSFPLRYKLGTVRNFLPSGSSISHWKADMPEEEKLSKFYSTFSNLEHATTLANARDICRPVWVTGQSRQPLTKRTCRSGIFVPAKEKCVWGIMQGITWTFTRQPSIYQVQTILPEA